MLPPEKVFQYCPRILKLPLFWQIKREIETMKLIKHPNVVRLYEVPLCLQHLLQAICCMLILKISLPLHPSLPNGSYMLYAYPYN
jgi:serine/threonine protein kinase